MGHELHAAVPVAMLIGLGHRLGSGVLIIDGNNVQNAVTVAIT